MVRQAKRNTIQTVLFRSYSVLIATVVVIAVFVFHYYTVHILSERAIDSIRRLAAAITQQLDLEIRKMDIVSLNIGYSNLVRDNFAQYLSEASNPFLKHKYARTLVDIFMAINGPLLPVRQINLYGLDGHMIGAGFMNASIPVKLDNFPWYPKVLELDGKKYISVPYREAFFLGETYKDKYFLSLYRVYFNNFRERMGVIEVVQDCNAIFAGVEKVIDPTLRGGVKVIILNGEKEPIYPLALAREEYLPYLQHAMGALEGEGESFSFLRNPITKERELLVFGRSEYTGWLILLVQGTESIMLSATQFTRFTLIITLVALGLSFLFSFLIARRFSRPIKRIHELIRDTSLDNLGEKYLPKLDGGVDELEELNQAFRRMSVNVKKAIHGLVIAKQRENEAKMIALQSQINPHFLRNCLANISVMAEEGEVASIGIMCQNISSMLGYILSDTSWVELGTEVEYTARYLEVMKLRYGENLRYTIDIPEKMRKIRVPKLIVQPLVENAVKYGLTQEPPWFIEIKGEVIAEDVWRITVKDNGPGWSEEVVERLRRWMEETINGDAQPEEKGKGMGLLNVLTRLRVVYGEKAVFLVANDPHGGAKISVGGKIEHG